MDIVFTRDGTGKAIRMDYSLIGFPSNTWFAIFLNEIETDRIRTNVSGQLIGFLDSIPPAYDIALTCVGDIRVKWYDNSRMPSSGIVCGLENFIEDEEDATRDGAWSLELRYD